MRILVTGAGGQLGLELQKLLPREGHEVVAVARADLDIVNSGAVGHALEVHRPDLVVNAAAYTDVDGCETETDLAYAANVLGPRNLAQHCRRFGCELMHISTNYVFDGEKEGPYETFDLANPISVYGLTKLAGEDYVRQLCDRWYLVRTAGVYGEGHNFVRTMLRVGKERGSLKVKDDEYISPTYAWDLAGGIVRIIRSGSYGVYHTTNSGSCSWYEFAQEIFRLSDLEVDVAPVPGSEYPLPAARPANGVLSNLGGPELRGWRAALQDYVEKTNVL